MQGIEVYILECVKLDECPYKIPNIPVKTTVMGNITEIQYMTRRNTKQTIQMLPGGTHYMVCATGEVIECVKHDSRVDNKKNLYKSFKLLRGLINSNVTDVKTCKWITLTYKENMTDTKKLYLDFKKFNMRFQYYCEKNNIGKPEYILSMEPQGRGAWHIHCLYIFPSVIGYIPHDDIWMLWSPLGYKYKEIDNKGYDYIKIKNLDDVDNVGAYLTAYLGDMDIEDMAQNNMFMLNEKYDSDQVKIIETDELDETGNKKKKYYIKGARLSLYPVNFNMVRSSRGIKRPIEEFMSQDEANKKVLGATKTFEKTVKLTDLENDFECIINTVQYNKIRKNNQ